MTNDLKPCPFCGKNEHRRGLRNIYCDSCGAEGPPNSEAISVAEAWNDRSDEVVISTQQPVELSKNLRIKADMISLGEPISFGSDSELMHQAADYIDSLQGRSDAEMERVKACEHIAEGDMEGNDWRVLRNICPSTAAVASLRDKYEALLKREVVEEGDVEHWRNLAADMRTIHISAFINDEVMPRQAKADMLYFIYQKCISAANEFEALVEKHTTDIEGQS